MLYNFTNFNNNINELNKVIVIDIGRLTNNNDEFYKEHKIIINILILIIMV